MLMHTNKLTLCLILGTLSLPVSAQGPNPFSDCGIGAALFPDTNWAAVTSNATWDLGTTALTSATASPETCTNQGKKVAVYIRDTYDQIVEESARGQNQHLSAAFELNGCSADAQTVKSATTSIRESVTSDTYSSKQHIEKAADLYNIIDTACNV